MSGDSSVPSPAPATPEFVGRPTVGRLVVRDRCVGLGDASPAGRLRLDAIARYLQDVANDDSRDAGLFGVGGWVVRRTALRVTESPLYADDVTLVTWCGGLGARWAERRTTITSSNGGIIEAATLWVHIDPTSGRPATLPPGFDKAYADAASGRRIRAALWHPEPTMSAVPLGQWHPRFCEFDVLGHVNNANYWAQVEELLAAHRVLRPPMLAVVEHRDAVEPGAVVELYGERSDNALMVWFVVEGSVRATARVETER